MKGLCCTVWRLGRDAALWLTRKHGRLTLRELGQLVDGISYAMAAQAISRFSKRLECNSDVRAKVRTIEIEFVECIDRPLDDT
jgi:hypothetical protein